MRPNVLQRPVLGGLVLVLAATALSGCSWFRREPDYLSSTESRPLEVPPDLVLPASTGALQVPSAVGASAVPGQVPPALLGAGEGFTIADSPESAFRRVGIALERIEGVNIRKAVAALNAYEVGFGGESFLVRLAPQDGQVRIDAISPDGRPLASNAARQLLGTLRTRLQ